MFSRSMLLKTFLFVSVILLTGVTAPAAIPNDQSADNSAGTIHTYLMPDLSLKSVFAVPLAPESETSFKPKGSCRCSCAVGNCKTDADCGPGGICDAFISCCAKLPEVKWFDVAAEASRKTAPPPISVTCNK